jgi:hypothetical protein
MMDAYTNKCYSTEWAGEVMGKSCERLRDRRGGWDLIVDGGPQLY